MIKAKYLNFFYFQKYLTKIEKNYSKANLEDIHLLARQRLVEFNMELRASEGQRKAVEAERGRAAGWWLKHWPQNPGPGGY